MKKIVFVGLVVLLSLSACVPDLLNSGSQDAPAAPVDIAATVDAAASTQVAQTFEALSLATPTMEVPITEPRVEEASVTATETVLPSEALTLETTETPDGTLPAETETETLDGTFPAETATAMPVCTFPEECVTATPDGTLVSRETATPEVTATSIYPSPTSPISINQPPDYIPRYKIKIVNNTKVRVYISLQGVTEGGYRPIIEYDLDPWEKAKFPIPEGKYTAIVYVGKDPMVAYFGVHSNNTITIIIDKDKIKIDK